MIPIRIFMLLLTVIRTAKIESTAVQLKRLIREKSCSKEHLKEYMKLEVGTKDKFKPTKASKQLRQICPSIQYSCCSLKQVQYLKDRVLLGRAFWSKMYELAKGVSISFRKLEIDREEIRKMLNENPNSTVPEYRLNLDNYFNMMENIEEITHTEYAKVQKSFDLIMSSFGCEICNYTFTTKLDLRETKGFRLRFNFDNIKLIAEALEPLEKIENAFFGFQIIFRWIYLLKGTNLTNFIWRRSLRELIDLWKRCSILSLEDYLKDEECENKLKKEVYLRYYSHPISLYRVYYEAIKNMDEILKFQGKPIEINKYNNIEHKDIAFEIFPQPGNIMSYPLTRFYTEKRGIEIRGNEMNLENNVLVMVVLPIIYLLMNQF